MKRTRRRLAQQILGVAWAAALVASEVVAAPPGLGFGVVPTESAVHLRKDYERIRTDLERAVGRPVEMVFAPDYAGAVEAMRFGHVHLALFGNVAAIAAVDRAGAEVFARSVDKDGNPGYWAHIVVPAGSPIRSLEDLLAQASSLTFAMGDPQSTSGTLVPGYYAFALRGVNPRRAFRAVRSSHHEANLLAVANRQVDAATTNNETFFRLQARMPEIAARVRIIWTSPLIASDPLLFRSDLPEETKAAIRGFFLGYGDTPEERAAIAPLKLSGFVPSDNRQLVPYRAMRLERAKAEIEGDSRVSEEERRRRLAEIDRERAALGPAEPSVAPGGGHD